MCVTIWGEAIEQVVTAALKRIKRPGIPRQKQIAAEFHRGAGGEVGTEGPDGNGMAAAESARVAAGSRATGWDWREREGALATREMDLRRELLFPQSVGNWTESAEQPNT